MSSSLLLVYLLFAGWTDQVEPLLTKEQKQAYRALPDEASRSHFEDEFWQTKTISRDEFEQRMTYMRSAFGGWRSDRGRVYLSLGAPEKISRLASTRSFWPIEIWYYRSAATIGFSGALQFLFYQRNQTGDYRLYSPTLDTFTALLNPQSGTRGAFRTNDILTEGDIRNTMSLTPAETEIVDAAIGVAKGVKGVENDALIARAASPADALSRRTGFSVSTRLLTSSRPALTLFQSWSEDGVPLIDLSFETPVKRSIAVAISTENTELSVAQLSGRRVRYQHRLALLPGTYTLTVTVDDLPFTYPVEVSSRRPMSEILAGEGSTQATISPFAFGTVHLDPGAQKQALVQVPVGQTVRWRMRQNERTVWTGESAGPVAVATPEAPPGAYQLEARSGTETRECRMEIGAAEPTLPVVSYNANLSPADRARSLGRQWLARGRLVEARTWLERARSLGASDAVEIDLARLSALAGDLDSPRKTLLAIIARNPNEFEALTVLGFIEAQLQDYEVAKRYYRRAMAIRPSPALEKVLEQMLSSKTER